MAHTITIKRTSPAIWHALLLLATCPALAAESLTFEPGPLEPGRVTAATTRAGFRVRDLKVDIAVAVRPRLPYGAPDYENDALVDLRARYLIEKLAAQGRDEWQSQLLLKEWVHNAIPGGSPKISYNNALEILA